MRTVRENIDTYRDAAETIGAALADLQVQNPRSVAHVVLREMARKGLVPIEFSEYDELRTAATRPITSTVYREFRIVLDPKPVPRNIVGQFSFVHIDYDGAPDAYDTRYGFADSVEEAKQMIDDMIAEHEP